MRQATLGTSGILSVLAACAAVAAPPGGSARPESRPPDGITVATAISTRPSTRPADVSVPPVPVDPAILAAQAAFDAWVAGFRPRARAAGIKDATLDAAFAGVTYDPEVIAKDRNQTEFNRTIWDYLDRAVSETRIANGKAALELHAALLDRIEARYGVEKEVLVAIWGMESAYGTHRGSLDVIRSLATLSHDGRRGKFFEAQLIAALTILQSGDTAPRDMTGSWAGAMGHTQFMPGSYLDLAVDFTGDGRRDIWSDDPSDALASTAAYLAHHGWTKGQPWGVEVMLPQGFDYALADRKLKKAPSDWAALGVTERSGRAVPDHGPAALLLPAGHEGAAFLVFDNFQAIERYNAADAYVISVGHLSDRIAGGEAFAAEWPREDRALTRAERKEVQARLTAASFDTGGVDGMIGPNTLAAVRAFQKSKGLVPDGYAGPGLLDRLR
ncbi:lytic murein transglycosylase [Sulfitobacter sp. D35]|uniref:lytic murein transglycosylase n=1 Tax=Sulfitobacter sp. D35 TaxID=3083252 RepID=UPI00296FB97F|nr:lytic murein transglycosylase [Sulfitobacter sp. D35]MDW4498140.1 lytic murein transglycosylase [Sulfitobacter sp. D35]